MAVVIFPAVISHSLIMILKGMEFWTIQQEYLLKLPKPFTKFAWIYDKITLLLPPSLLFEKLEVANRTRR